MPATSVLHKQLVVLWRCRETPQGGNTTFAVLCYSLHPSLSSSSIAPVHLCHLTNDRSAAVSLSCIIYPELQRGSGLERERETEEKEDIFFCVYRLKENNNDVQKERMRIRRDVDRGADTIWDKHVRQRQCKGRRWERAGGNREARFINHSPDLVGNADSSGWN